MDDGRTGDLVPHPRLCGAVVIAHLAIQWTERQLWKVHATVFLLVLSGAYDAAGYIETISDELFVQSHINGYYCLASKFDISLSY